MRDRRSDDGIPGLKMAVPVAKSIAPPKKPQKVGNIGIVTDRVTPKSDIVTPSPPSLTGALA